MASQQPAQSPQKIDTGLACLLMLTRYFGIPADPHQLYHEFGTSSQPFGDMEILRAAKRLGLKMGKRRATWARVDTLRLPAIAQYKDGQYVILARVEGDRTLIHDPRASQPQVLEEQAFAEEFNSTLLLCTTRAHLQSAWRRFDFTWFLPAILKYRKHLSEVVVASFFLQLFGLLTPLFFQVITDKVLVHKGGTTLQVLAIGMMAVSGFEAILGGLRAYIFSHTSNRIDVSLGTQLFAHIVRLPLAYFQVRRAGDTIARVRGLDSIRQFLTSSAITVMLYYSPLLTAVVAGSLPCYAVLSIVVTPIIRSRLRERFDRGAENQAFLVEVITGIETVKAMAVEPAMQRRWDDQIAEYVRASFRATLLSNNARQIASWLNKTTTVALVWLGAGLVMRGELTIGQLIAFNMLAGRVSDPVLRLVQLWQDFQQAGISVERLGDILNAPLEPHASGAGTVSRTTLPNIQGHVTFEQVLFRYRADVPPVLQGLSFGVRSGTVIGIVGRSS